MMVVGLPSAAASSFSFTELGEVTALRGGFPLLVGVVRILVGDVRGLGTPGRVVVVSMLRVVLRRVALVVVMVMVAVQVHAATSTPNMAAAATVGGCRVGVVGIGNGGIGVTGAVRLCR